MTKKEWLNRAWRLELEIRALEQEKERAFGRACAATGQATNDRVQTGKSKVTDSRFASYAEYTTFLNDKINQLYNIKKEVLEAISEVDNPVYRALLTDRYINFKKWEQIAVDIHHDYYYTRKKLHPRAIQALKIPPNHRV